MLAERSLRVRFTCEHVSLVRIRAGEVRIRDAADTAAARERESHHFGCEQRARAVLLVRCMRTLQTARRIQRSARDSCSQGRYFETSLVIVAACSTTARTARWTRCSRGSVVWSPPAPCRSSRPPTHTCPRATDDGNKDDSSTVELTVTEQNPFSPPYIYNYI